MALPVPLCIAIQGERGAYSQEAAVRLLGDSIKIVPARDSPHMFSSVARHRAHACLAPMENSLVGSIYSHYDLMLRFGFRVLGEVYLRVEHCLIAPVGTFFEEVERVYSHPVALEQCQEFFRGHPGIQAVVTYDTAGSVQMLVERKEARAAAIAGRGAAEHYGARILRANLEDDPANYTRFFLLGLEDDPEVEGIERAFRPGETAGPKTSIVFYVDNRPGALQEALGEFSDRGVDLAKIESRPIRGKPFEYLFYLDVLGDAAVSPVREALESLGARAGFLRVLGTYRAGRLDWVGRDEPFLPRAAAAPPRGDDERRSAPGDRRHEDRRAP